MFYLNQFHRLTIPVLTLRLLTILVLIDWYLSPMIYISHLIKTTKWRLFQYLKVFDKIWHEGLLFKEVRYNCNAHRSAHHFMIAISSHSHITRKQPQGTFLQYSCSATMINIVKKYLSRKIHKLNTLIGSSNNC